MDIYPRVFGFALRLTGNRDDAADVAQDAFVRAYQGRSQRVEEGRLDSWMFRIAFRCFLDRERINRRQLKTVSFEALSSANVVFDPTDGAANPAQSLLNKTMSEPMKKALASLSVQERSLMRMAYFEELSPDELSVALHCGKATVKTRLYRARQVLKRRLAAAGLQTYSSCRQAAA